MKYEIITQNKILYEYFPEYSELEVKSILKKIPNKFKKFFILKNKKIIDIVYVDERNNSDMELFQELLNYIRINLEKKYPRKIKTIYDYFPEYKKEEVDLVIENLTDKAKQILKKKYGEDLKNPKINNELTKVDSKYFTSSVLLTIRRYLTKKRTIKLEKTIYDYFLEYKKEEVDMAIDSLSEDAINALKLKYEENIKEPSKIKKLKKEEENVFKSVGLFSVKRILKNKNKKVKTIYDYFPNNSYEEIDSCLKKVPKRAKMILEKKYGKDLKKTIYEDCLNQKEKRYFLCHILPYIRKILKEQEITKANYDLISPILTNDDYKKIINILKQFILNKLLEIFTYDEAIIIILKLILNYDTKVISNLLNIREEMVLDVSKRFLNYYKNKKIYEFTNKEMVKWNL